MPQLPAGFVLDTERPQKRPALPPGFVLDQGAPQLPNQSEEFKNAFTAPDTGRPPGVPDYVEMARDYEARGGKVGEFMRSGMDKLGVGRDGQPGGPSSDVIGGLLDLGAAGVRAGYDYYADPNKTTNDKIAGTVRGMGEMSGIAPLGRVASYTTGVNTPSTDRLFGTEEVRRPGYDPTADVATAALGASFSAGPVSDLTGGVSDIAKLGGNIVVKGSKEAAQLAKNGLRSMGRTGAAAPSPSPVSSVPPTSPRPAQAGGGAGQGAARPVLNAVPAAPVLSKGQARVAKDTAKILARIMRSSRIKDADVAGYLPGAVQRFKSLNDSRVPFAFFLEDDLPKHFPEPVAADVVTKLRTWGRERNAATGPQDTSRKTIQQTIQTLRGSQQDVLTNAAEDAMFKGSLIGQEDSIVKSLRETGQKGYEPVLARAREITEGTRTPNQAEREAVERLRALLNRPVFRDRIPNDVRMTAEAEGFDLQHAIETDPIGASHWLQSNLRKLEDAAEDVGGKQTPASLAYGKMREDVLDALQQAAPGYEGVRKRYGDQFGAKEAVGFGKGFFRSARSAYDTAKLARRLKALGRRQQTVAWKSIRDELLNEFRGTAEDAAAKVTRLQQEGTLDALEQLGARGKRMADAIRKIAQTENPRIRAIDQASGSNTFSNFEGAKAAREAVQSPINKAIGAFGDKTSWPMTVAGDVALTAVGAPPVLTVGKAVTSLVDRFGNPSAKTLSRATEGLYGLPQRNTNGLLSSTALSPPRKPGAPRVRKTPSAEEPQDIEALLKQLDEAERDAKTRGGAEGKRLLNEISKARSQLMASPPAGKTGGGPPKMRGFGGSPSKPFDMSEAARMQTRHPKQSRSRLPIDDETLKQASQKLYPREFEAFKGAREGLDNEEIAVRMSGPDGEVTPVAVSVYLDRARQKGFDTEKLASGRRFNPETLQMLNMLARGASPVEVAEALGKSQSAVNTAKWKYADQIAAIRNRSALQKGVIGSARDGGDVRYFDPDASADSLKAMQSRMIANNEVPAILLFRTDAGRIIAMGAEDVGYSHDVARRMLGLGDLKLEHGVYNPKKWPTPEAMADAGKQAWYDTTGTVSDRAAKGDRLRRAEEQGFNTNRVLYHGTDAEFDAFEPSKFGELGPGIYLGDEAVAQEFGANVIPVYVRGKLYNLTEADARGLENYRDQTASNALVKRLKEQGYTGIENPWTGNVSVFDPRDVRHVDANFDPAQSQSSALMSGMGGAPTEGIVADWAIPAASGATTYFAQPEGTSPEQRMAAAGMSFLATKMAMPFVRGGVGKVANAFKSPATKEAEETFRRVEERIADYHRKGAEAAQLRAQGVDDTIIARRLGLDKSPDGKLSAQELRDEVQYAIDAAKANPPERAPPKLRGSSGGGDGPPGKPPGGKEQETARLQRGRDQGFDVENTLYHGTARDFKDFDDAATGSNIRESAKTSNPSFRGVWLTRDPSYASTYARGEGANVRPVFIRGKLIDGDVVSSWARSNQKTMDNHAAREAAVQRAKDEGYTGIDSGEEIQVFDAQNIRSKFDSFAAPPKPPAGEGGGPRAPEKLSPPKPTGAPEGKGNGLTLPAKSEPLNRLAEDNGLKGPIKGEVLPALGKNGLASPPKTAQLSPTAQKAKAEVSRTKAAYTRAYNRSFGMQKQVPQEEYLRPYREAWDAAEAEFQRVMANDAKLARIGSRITEAANGLKAGLNAESAPGRGSVGKGLLIGAGAGALGTGALAGINALKGPPKDRPMSPSDPAYYWTNVIKDSDKVRTIQDALEAEGYWDPKITKTGNYGKVTRDAVRAWRYDHRMDPDKPFTRRELQQLLAPHGYQDERNPEVWRYGDGRAVPAL